MQRNISNTQDTWRLTGALREPLPRSYRYIRRRRRYYWIKASYPVFPNSSPVGAAANKLIQPHVKKLVEVVTLPDDYKHDPLEPLPHFMRMVNTVSICRRGLISMYFNAVLYTGGATNWSDIYTINIALRDGKVWRLSFDDLFRTPADGEVVVREHVTPRIYEAIERRARRHDRSAAELPRVQLASQNHVASSMREFDYNRFVLTPTAIMWVIAQGEVDARAFGVYPIKVPYAEIRSRLAVRLD